MHSSLHFPRARRAIPALSAALMLAAACSKPAPRPQRPPITVAVVVAKRADVPYVIQANGVVTPIQSASVAAQVNGIVTRVAFKEGQEVRKGQLLFQIDPRPYQNAYLQARANYERDSASAANAAAERDRYQKLVASGVITEEEAQSYETTAATAQATVRADSALMATAKLNLDNTSVRAPIAGKTGAVLVREGNLVASAGGQPLVVINQVRPITVRFSVPSSELPRLQRYAVGGGLPVAAVPGGGTSDASSPVDSSQGPPMAESSPVGDALAAQGGATPAEQGVLSFIDNSVDTTTGTLQLKATFDNKDGNLWVGQYASTSMQLFIEKGALVVPAHALVTGQKGTYVYTLDADNKARQHPVAVERTTNGLAIIAAGVAEGDRVVTEGQSRLTPGAVASLRTAGDPPADGAPATGRRGRGGRGGRRPRWPRGAGGQRRRRDAGRPGAMNDRGGPVSLTALFIRRPVMTTLLMVGIVVFGVFAYRTLPVSDLPITDSPSIGVGASLPGASPETMAATVATPLEKAFSAIAGIDEITSNSSLGSTNVSLTFSPDRDIDAAAQDVNAAISQALPALPANIQPPSMHKQNQAAAPIMFLALTSNVLPMQDVDEIAETTIAQRLSMVEGVAQVGVWGAHKYAVRVELDPVRLASRNISVAQVAATIRNNNVMLPTGVLYGRDKTLTVMATGQLTERGAVPPADHHLPERRRGAAGRRGRRARRHPEQQGRELDQLRARRSGWR